MTALKLASSKAGAIVALGYIGIMEKKMEATI